MGTQAVICGGVRTPIGRFEGGLSSVRPDDLAALVLGAVGARAGLPADAVDEVVLGCANQAGEDNRNVARMATLLAGLPHTVPAVTVNRLCASGLEAVVQAARQVQVGDASFVLAGGVESMSRAPYSVPRGPYLPKLGGATMYDTALGWRYPNPKMEALFPLEQMGETAENVAERFGISRADQDAFALASHQKAIAAAASGAFAGEILPVAVRSGKADLLVTADEGPRPDASIESLGRLKPVFRAGGSVTAGNASSLNDGAAALIVARADAAQAHGLVARARIVGVAAAGVDPRVMGIGPVPAVQKALARAGLTVADVDAWELNEAFAAQALAVIRALGIEEDRVNRHGGAIALGHPLGCSGARILVSLLTVLERTGGTIGCASLCVGVGQGLAVVVAREA